MRARPKTASFSVHMTAAIAVACSAAEVAPQGLLMDTDRVTLVVEKPRTEHRSRTPRKLLTSAVVAGALAATVVAGFIVLSPENRDTGLVKLRTGVYRGVIWRLDAGTVNGQFCMQLSRVNGPHPGEFAGACVFDNDPTGPSYYYASGLGPRGSGVNYGPLPISAVAIRIATHQVVPTYPLPARSGMPKGRYWVDFEPDNWPAPQEGRPLNNPQPLDQQGKPVAYQAF